MSAVSSPATAARRVSVVLPLYKTARYLRELVQRLKDTLEKSAPDFELLMVDDGDPDNSWETLRELAAQDPRVKAIKLSRNFGQHPATAAGFEHATGDVIVLMDADLQDRPENIPLLLEKLQGDVDIVYTVKVGQEESFSTRMTSRLYHYVFSKLTGTSVPRNIGSFRAFTRRFLEALLAYPERNVLYGPLMFYAGFEYITVELLHDVRTGSRSAYTFRKRLRLAVNSILSYTDLPQRVLVNLGLLILACSGIYTLIVLIEYFFFGIRLPTGLTLVVLLLTVTLGVLMFSLGVIGAYVFRVYQEVLQRPRYCIARSINVTNVRGACNVDLGGASQHRSPHPHGR
jgi:polyisoprenyl-phosphate glycosyltransferase